MYKTLLIDWLTYVQNILQPSFVRPFDVVGPLGICLQCLCHNPSLLPNAAPVYMLASRLGNIGQRCKRSLRPGRAAQLIGEEASGQWWRHRCRSTVAVALLAKQHRSIGVASELLRSASWCLIFMVALCNRADHYYYFHVVVCSSSSSFFPRLISAAADWMSAILPHMVWP